MMMPMRQPADEQLFGEVLRAYRQRYRMTVIELAQAAGLDRDTVYAIEAGHNQPTLRTVRALARALGVRLAELLRDPVVPDVTVEPPAEGVPVGLAGWSSPSEVYRHGA
jgi:transcriptional regulator with XRE-family HTH domain